MGKYIFICIIPVLCFSCSAEQESDHQGYSHDDITNSAEIILSAENDERIANPSQISATESGFILYDDGFKQIMVFNENGEPVHTFGREGRGPGEFQTVSAMMYDGDHIVVSDPELLRLTSFDSDGGVVSGHELTPSLFAMNNAILSTDRYITPTNGREGGLAKFADHESGDEFVFGEPVVQTPESADFDQWHQDFSAGKVPDFFRNHIAMSGNGSLFYLFYRQREFSGSTIQVVS